MTMIQESNTSSKGRKPPAAAPCASPERDFVAFLERHVGKDQAVSRARIARALGISRHRVDGLVPLARSLGVAVCGNAVSGFYIAATVEELKELCTFLRARALATLATEAKVRHMPLYQVIDQVWMGQIYSSADEGRRREAVAAQ